MIYAVLELLMMEVCESSKRHTNEVDAADGY